MPKVCLAVDFIVPTEDCLRVRTSVGATGKGAQNLVRSLLQSGDLLGDTIAARAFLASRRRHYLLLPAPILPTRFAAPAGPLPCGFLWQNYDTPG